MCDFEPVPCLTLISNKFLKDNKYFTQPPRYNGIQKINK